MVCTVVLAVVMGLLRTLGSVLMRMGVPPTPNPIWLLLIRVGPEWVTAMPDEGAEAVATFGK
jgi:hypothetical protein